MFLLLAMAVALAGEPRDALDAGDLAWFAGNRGEAAARWKEAAEAPDPAVRAMAEARLLRVGGNLGWMVHGPRADRALAACPAEDPWCALAEADLLLTTRDLGLGNDQDAVAFNLRRAAAQLPAQAAARRTWAGEAGVDAQPPVDPSPLGQALLDHGGRWPAGPGTWFLGLGIVGAPGLGVGGTVRLVHPDIGWKALRLEGSATATSRGIGAAQVGLRTPGKKWGTASLSGAHTYLDVYSAEGVRTETVWQAVAAGAPGLSRGRVSVWLGPELRVDREEDWTQGHGLFGGATWDGRKDGKGPWARLGAEAAFADYPFGRATLDLREVTTLGPVTLAVRLLGDAVPLRSAAVPLARLPAAGGSDVLRGAPAGRYRGPWLGDGVLELRAPLTPWLGAAAWGEAAWVPVADDRALHPGGGVGLRLRLPPQPANTLRLDLGITEGGWGVVTGWGEAF